MKTIRRVPTLALAAWLAGSLPISAQQTGITGTLTDPSGAAVPGVAVSASGADGSKITATTNGDGLYQLPALRAQNYVLRLDAIGFAPAERTISLLVGQVISIDVSLKLATASTVVAVEAAAVTIDTTGSSIAGDVSPAEVSKVPLNGRNYLQLSTLV